MSKVKKEVSLYVKKEDIRMYIEMRNQEILPSVELLKSYFRKTQNQALLISDGPLGLVVYGQIEDKGDETN